MMASEERPQAEEQLSRARRPLHRPPAEHDAILLVGVELTQIRAALVEQFGATHRLAAWINVQRDGDVEMDEQVAAVCRRLGYRLGRPLWNEQENRPFLESEDPVRFPPLGQVLIGASPRPRLRTWLCGLSRRVSLPAAEQALAAVPAQVVGHTVLDARTDGGALEKAFVAAKPEAIVVTGGYDNPEPSAQTPLLAMCTLVTRALKRMPPSQYPAVIYAGNRWVAERAGQILAGAGDAIRVEAVTNVQPAPGVLERTELARALGYRHWQLCRRMRGFDQLERWVTSPAHISALETSFAQFAQVWLAYQNLPQLHALYSGPGWRLHVLARQGTESVDLHYAAPDEVAPAVRDWPAAQLVSGPLPRHAPAMDLRWWDRSGMAPLMALLGQVTPQAMLDVLTQDLLEEG